MTTDYKLLMKVFVARLMEVLPTILQKSQLCSVRGRDIMQGAISLWPTAKFIRQWKRRSFKMNLDFYHTYDHVSLPYIAKVLEAMGFGLFFREVVATLHRGASASFLLHRATRAMPITFSVRQGDPITILLYNIQFQPFLLKLRDELLGVSFPDFEERVEAYVNNMVAVGEDETDLLIIDSICRQLELVSRAILGPAGKPGHSAGSLPRPT